jgi:glutathione S-transferase
VTGDERSGRPTTFVHIAMPQDWAAAQISGEYRMSTREVTLDQEGFIHCSFDHQVEGTANRFYADVDELVLLRVDPALLGCEVVVEPPFPGSTELFPHAYGPIPLTAVVATTTWRRSEDGWHFAAPAS